MPPSATNQPPGSHGGSPCSGHLGRAPAAAPFPGSPACCRATGKQDSPFPSPRFLCLWQGKASQMCPRSWLGLGWSPWKSPEGGRKDGKKEGSSSACCWDGLPRGDVALPQGAAGSEGAGKQAGEAGRAGAEGQGFICTSSISQAPASAPAGTPHPSSPPGSRLLPAPSSLSTPSRAGMMTAPAPPGQHPSIKPFPAARAGAGSRRSIDLIKPRAIHPRSRRQLLVTQGQAPEPAGSWQPGRGCGTSRAVLLPWRAASTSRFQLAPSINPTHGSPCIPPLRQAEAQWGGFRG